MANKSSTQTEWLEDLRKNKTPVTVIITNGFQMQGTIKDFDDFIILFKIKFNNRIYTLYYH